MLTAYLIVSQTRVSPRCALRRSYLLWSRFCPWGRRGLRCRGPGMEPPLHYRGCASRDTGLLRARGGPCRPPGALVSHSVRRDERSASRCSRDSPNVPCHLSGVRPVNILIAAICPRFGMRGQIPPEVFFFFCPLFLSISNCRHTVLSQKEENRAPRPNPQPRNSGAIVAASSRAPHPAEEASLPAPLSSTQPDLI